MTPPQKDEFLRRLEKTTLTTIIASVSTALILSIGTFFYVKFQTDANTEAIRELKALKADMMYVNQFEKRNDQDHSDLKKGIQDLKSGNDRIYNFLLTQKNR
jgi:hypothetical protein